MYLDETELQSFSERSGQSLTPRVATLESDELPQSVEQTLRFLNDHIPETRSRLDSDGKGQSEGLVIRTRNRSSIAKMRFKDYEDLAGKRRGK